MPLPSGYTARRPNTADAAAIFALVSAYNTAVIGEPGYTEDDIADELVEPGFDPDSDGWLVDGPDGRLVGWAWVIGKGDSDNADVAVYTAPGVEVVAPWLWDRVEARGAEIAAAKGHPTVSLDIGLYREESAAEALVQERGYEVAAIFNRLRIDFTPGSSVDYPVQPDGVTMRNAADDEAVRRDAHAAYTASFADHFGFVAESFEEWSTRVTASSTHDWSQVDVIYLEGNVAGMLRRTNAYLEEEGCGYVHQLAVHPDYQGRGLGRYLLRYAFAADATLGRTGTLLHVDTDPSRPALGLYLSAGMRLVRVINVWRKVTQVNSTNWQEQESSTTSTNY